MNTINYVEIVVDPGYIGKVSSIRYRLNTDDMTRLKSEDKV